MELILNVYSDSPGFTIIAVGGEIDVYTAPKLREKLISLVDHGSYQLIVDMEGVEFLDSNGLGVLIGGLKRVRTHGGWIDLVCTQARILRIFRITGLNKVFNVYDTVADAIAAHTQEAFADLFATGTAAASADASPDLATTIADQVSPFSSAQDARNVDEQHTAHETSDASTKVGFVPVSIYLTEEGVHEQVERVVERWLSTANVFIRVRDEPIIGSWFRRLEGVIKKAAITPLGREATLTAQHIADSRIVQSQDAYITSTLLQNVGPVLQALHPTKDAVVRAGALLIIKIEWVVQVHQLTAAQQAILDHQPHLAASPKEIIAALQLPNGVMQGAAIPGAVRPADHGDNATASD